MSSSPTLVLLRKMFCSIFDTLAVHADGQYQSDTFQDALYAELGNNDRSADPFFLTPWDVSHWMDLVMVEMREESVSSEFLKRLIKRSNRLHTMFARGRGNVEYKGLASPFGLKVLETVVFATTRFFSSAYEQWHKIYVSYKALMEAFRRCRENENDEEEETKYQVRFISFENSNVYKLFKQEISLGCHSTLQTKCSKNSFQ